MRRLGYDRYVAQGGDVGAAVTDSMGRQAPEGLAGIHMNLLLAGLGGGYPSLNTTPEERAALEAVTTFRTSGNGYLIEQNTRPQTIGYALLDSPVALAAWMLDHDTDAYYKISAAFTGGQPSGGLTRDHVLDNITLYWLTSTGASAARSYWENTQAAIHAAASGPVRRSRSGSVSPRSPARSSGPRAAGPRSPTPASATSTRPTRAATSPPGKSPSCSRPRSARHSSRCANDSPHPGAGRWPTAYQVGQREDQGHGRDRVFGRVLATLRLRLRGPGVFPRRRRTPEPWPARAAHEPRRPR
jgi:hypothetical protein